MNDRKYSSEEAKQLLKEALKKQGEKNDLLSEEDIVSAAKEMGVDEETIRSELREVERENETVPKAKEDRPAVRGFIIHLVVFVVVNLMLSRGRMWGFGPPVIGFFPFFPWIIFLVLHGLKAFGVIRKGRSCGDSNDKRGCC